ncbi:MAG: Clp protease N-terminal domain-containing protein [Euzebya sp.]
MDEMPGLDDLIAMVKDRHPEGDALQDLAEAVMQADLMSQLADHLTGHFVDQARLAGASWTEIGAGMGVTKQAAQKRFVPRQQPADVTEDPDGPFSRFSRSARAATDAAKEHARTAHNEQVGTEHVVLGLLDQLEGMAAQAIEALEVPLEQVREAARSAFTPPSTQAHSDVPFGRDAMKMLQMALREALRTGNGAGHVGTQHLLLGLLGDGNSTGATILRSLGITRRQAEEWLKDRSPEE